MKEHDEMSLEELEKHAVLIDQLVLDFPLDIRATYFWKMLRYHGRLGCCCCCCDDHHAPHPGGAGGGGGAGGPGGGPGVPGPGGAPGAAAAPQATLTGTAFVLTIPGVPGGGPSARVDFEWDVTGGSNIKVDIEVRTVQQYNGYNWTPVTNLSDQPASGRGIWWGFGLSLPGMIPGFNHEARAVAKENGVVKAYSNVITF